MKVSLSASHNDHEQPSGGGERGLVQSTARVIEGTRFIGITARTGKKAAGKALEVNFTIEEAQCLLLCQS